MVIDFSRLNSSSSLTGSTRTSGTKDSAGQRPAAEYQGRTGQYRQSGESVHLSNEAQQLQKVTDKLRDQPVVNKARVAELKQRLPMAATKSTATV
jgi:negative regulator of flagellin synthesis FlgM